VKRLSKSKFLKRLEYVDIKDIQYLYLQQKVTITMNRQEERKKGGKQK
jgi:hypothetical protein